MYRMVRLIELSKLDTGEPYIDSPKAANWTAHSAVDIL